MRRKKQIKRGGGYDSNMEVNPIGLTRLCTLDQGDTRPRVMQFTVTNKTNNETTIYDNIGYLAGGTYGTVYLVKRREDNVKFVIKIQTKYPSIKKEAEDLDRIMAEVTGNCKYVAVSQGVTDNKEHAVFPYLGSKDLEKLIDESAMDMMDMMDMIPKVPKILTDVIGCLDALHSREYSHLDIKLSNIVFDEVTEFAHIVDYGLSLHNDMVTMMTIGEIVVGEFQLSVEMIIVRFCTLYDIAIPPPRVGISPPPPPPPLPPPSDPQPIVLPRPQIITQFRNTFIGFADKIKQTSDNFGLFWLIIGLLTYGQDIIICRKYFQKYAPYDAPSALPTLCSMFAFYYSLSLNGSEQQHELIEAIVKTNFCNVNRIGTQAMRSDFIVTVRTHIPTAAFTAWFRDDEKRFNAFIENVILLVHVDPEIRIISTELLKDPFFLERWDAKDEVRVNPEQFIAGVYPQSAPSKSGGKRNRARTHRRGTRARIRRSRKFARAAQILL